MTTHETHWSPAVRALVERAKAEALREALVALRDQADADVEVALGGVDWVLSWLRARADSLAAQPAPEAATAEEGHTAEKVPCTCGASLVTPYPNDTGYHSTTECIDEATGRVISPGTTEEKP